MTKQQLDDKVTFDGFSLGDLMNFGNYILVTQSCNNTRIEVTNEDIENWKESQVECSSGNCCKN